MMEKTIPTYRFENKNTKEIYDEFMSMADLDKYLEANPHVTQIVGDAFYYGDPFKFGSKKGKPDQGFREVLRNIKKKNRGSNINTF